LLQLNYNGFELEILYIDGVGLKKCVIFLEFLVNFFGLYAWGAHVYRIHSLVVYIRIGLDYTVSVGHRDFCASQVIVISEP
jgi:hypothetical protein